MTLKNTVFVLLLLSTCHVDQLAAQTEEQQLIRFIFEQDSLFWHAYNTCDDQAGRRFFTEDIEFYHDKGGITLGADNLAASIKNNLCSNPNFKLRRAAVPETVQVYPLAKDGQFYGAIISGEHLFFVTENGKPEFQSGVARFNQLWLKQDGTWRMARILSYDHQPPRFVNQRIQVGVTANVLAKLTGTYVGPQTGNIEIQAGDQMLYLLIGNQKWSIFPASDRLFFTKDRDLTFEFQTDSDSQISKIVIREFDKIVEEAVKQH